MDTHVDVLSINKTILNLREERHRRAESDNLANILIRSFLRCTTKTSSIQTIKLIVSMSKT